MIVMQMATSEEIKLEKGLPPAPEVMLWTYVGADKTWKLFKAMSKEAYLTYDINWWVSAIQNKYHSARLLRVYIVEPLKKVKVKK